LEVVKHVHMVSGDECVIDGQVNLCPKSAVVVAVIEVKEEVVSCMC
jgi:hypothetical protein